MSSFNSLTGPVHGPEKAGETGLPSVPAMPVMDPAKADHGNVRTSTD
jgi:hypothetical protein